MHRVPIKCINFGCVFYDVEIDCVWGLSCPEDIAKAIAKTPCECAFCREKGWVGEPELYSPEDFEAFRVGGQALEYDHNPYPKGSTVGEFWIAGHEYHRYLWYIMDTENHHADAGSHRHAAEV